MASRERAVAECYIKTHKKPKHIHLSYPPHFQMSTTKLAIDPAFRAKLEDYWAHRQSCYNIAFPRPVNKIRTEEGPPQAEKENACLSPQEITQPVSSSWYSIWQLPSLWWRGT